MKEAKPAIIADLIERFSQLPGVGRKTAERYVYYLINQTPEVIRELADKIADLPKSITKCESCNRIAEDSPCNICHDSQRDKSIICVVAESQDLAPIESSKHYRGQYHVLGGVLNPLEGITPDKLTIKALLQRLEKNGVKEIILALNPDIEGESTALQLAKTLKNKPVKVTRLARGLPMGSDLAYADEVTLSNAIKGRQEV
ncbi:recombination mediator RecR [Patescibacteria group bacterium]